MKILLVNSVYGYGSTGKIMLDLCNGLINRGHEVRVCYGRGKKSNIAHVDLLASPILQKVQSLCSKITGRVYECSPISTYRLFSIIKEWNPDVVNLHCVNSNTLNVAETISFLKRNSIPTVISNHAEFLYTGGCGHSLNCNKWKTGCADCEQIIEIGSQLPKSFTVQKPHQYWLQLQSAYKGFNNLVVTGVSPWLVDRMKESPFLMDKKLVIVGNGLNTEVFSPRPFEYLMKRHHLTPGEPIILHVTPNFNIPIKGGKYVLEVAKKLMESMPVAKIIIVGFKGDAANLPANIIPVAFTKDQRELADYYSMASLTLLTSEKETFSMVCAESLCCGTPVVGFKAGAPETISIKEFSRFVDFGNIDELHQAILDMIDLKIKKSINTEYAHHIYSTENMVCKYEGCYKEASKR